MTRGRGRPLTTLNPVDDDTGCVIVVIETPKGRRTKVAYDPDRDAFVVKKVLPEGMTFPFDFGFIPATRGEDGDPLDVLVLMDEPVMPGTLVAARLVGVIEAEQTESDGTSEQNDRLLAVAHACVMYKRVKRLSDVPPVVIEQIEHFFVSYNEQEGKRFVLKGTHGRKQAGACFERGRRAYRRRDGAGDRARSRTGRGRRKGRSGGEGTQ